ncbi:unnamed protein product [Trichobilharzia regenti]|nr:unnamed protein product [Trichobilharzia regenti]
MNDITKVNRHCITPEGQFEEGIISLISQPLHIYNYYFWIHYEPAIEKLFENPNDRRIESIGRRTDCYIQLTKYIRRNAKGFIQIMVNILAPTASALLKCCKLFDDKFPTFYASANLLLEYNDLIDLTNFRVFLPNLRKKLSTFSLLPTTDYLYSNIYNDFYDKNNFFCCLPVDG